MSELAELLEWRVDIETGGIEFDQDIAMNKPLIALLLLSFSASGAWSAWHICRIEGGEVEILRRSRMIAYSREFMNQDWAKDEAGYETPKRFPIYGMAGSTGKSDPKGLYAAAYPADYFPVKLVPVDNQKTFRLDGLMWIDYRAVEGPRKHYIEKYSGRNVEYHLSLEENPSCSESKDVSVDVKLDGKTVERILFHVKDMTGAKDFWPEERVQSGGG